MEVKFPVVNTLISQPFGYDNTDNMERGSFYSIFGNKHPGVDFPVGENTEVFASFPGIVVRKEFHKGMGNVIGIRNGSIVALYVHLNEFNVDLSDIVKDQQLIGLSGATGAACLTPHLHFELRDISKRSLKDMVFDPPFNNTCSNHQDTFVYVVNNKNTQKTLKSLSVLFFGSENYSEKIKEVNNLTDISDTDLLRDGEELKITNY